MEPEMHNLPDTLSSPNTPEVGAAPAPAHQDDSATQVPAPALSPSIPASGGHEEERQTLLATLAASRDLGPEMDHALADHYFEQRALARSRTLRHQQRMPRSFSQRARQIVQRLQERRLLWPIVISAVTLAGITSVVAISAIAALHGFPHHGLTGTGFHDQSGANTQPGQQPDGRPDPDGFFPFMGVFPWFIPLALLFFFLRRRRRALAGRYQAYGNQLGQVNRPNLPPGYQPPMTLDDARGANTRMPSTHLPQPTSPTEDVHNAAQQAAYTAYQPYDPFGASASATTTRPPSVDDSKTTQPTAGVVTNEVSPPPTTRPLSNPAG